MTTAIPIPPIRTDEMPCYIPLSDLANVVMLDRVTVLPDVLVGDPASDVLGVRIVIALVLV